MGATASEPVAVSPETTLREQLRRHERQLDALAAVATQLQRAEDVPGILNAALREIRDRMGIQAAWVFLGEESPGSGARLRLAASLGLSERYLGRTASEGLAPCLCQDVFERGDAMQARNTLQCPRMPELLADHRTVAHACVPLRFEGPSRGVLNVAAHAGETFADDELRFLETLGRQICLALERARHRTAERRLQIQAQAMMAISKSVGGTLDAATVIDAIGETAEHLLGVDQLYVLLGSEAASMRVGYATGAAGLEIGQPVDIDALDWRLARAALETRDLVQCDDCAASPLANRQETQRLGIGAVLIAPLLAHDFVEGLLIVARREAGPWTADQRDVLGTLATQAALALETARLYQEARSAYQELRDAQTRIIQSEKMAVLGTFASGLAHEVRNPLNSIALQLSLLERRTARMGSAVAAPTAELLNIIRDEVRRLDGLVGDFLVFARTSAMRPQPTDLRALADEVLRLLEPEAASAGVELGRRSGSGPTPKPSVDAERLKQVLINLVRNAIEAVPRGGRVEVLDEEGETGTWLRVRDDGPGLPPGLDVFQLFVTSKPGGTGLGLPIAQQIIHEHGGEITVDNPAGGGAIFSVRLPRSAGTRAPGGSEP